MSEEYKYEGVAEDGTQYNIESPEVIKYMEKYPDVEKDAAVAHVISMHNNGTLAELDEEAEAEDEAV